MKMKDSMDQMEFDRGNPQEDAPRRVQKRKKLNWKPVWFAVTTAVLAAVLLVASLTDTTAFDGLRRSITYAGQKKMRRAAPSCTTMPPTAPAASPHWTAVWPSSPTVSCW